MSLSLFKKFCIGSMLGFVAWTTTSFAQTNVTVNGAACPGASVMFSSSGIAITTSNCGVVVTPPTISSLNPSAASPGNTVTVNGSNFVAGQTSVTVGGVAATGVNVTGSTSLTFIVPAVSAGSPNVLVTVSGAVSNASPLTITVPVPVVSSVAPAGGVPGTVVTVTGTNFASGATATIGGLNAPVTNVSATTLDVTIPSMTAGGAYPLIVFVGGVASNNNVTVSVSAATPVISGIAPASAAIGSNITISGSGFAPGAQVTVGGVAGTVVGIPTAGSIVVTVPTVGTGAQVVLVKVGGVDSAPSAVTVTAPVVTPTVSSCSGTIGGNLTIVGANFVAGSTTATLNALALTLTTVSASGISATVPAGITANGSYPLLVTVSGQTSSSFSCTITGGAGGPDTSVENVVIPTPSKFPNVVPNPRNGQLNGAGPDLNAYAVDVARCAGKTTPALTRSWQHNIEFASYAGESPVDYVTMNAGEALSFRFVAPATGYRFITFNPATLGRYVGNFLSISTSPCDFNDAPASNMRACYAARNSGNNDITYQVIGTGAPDISACKLTPGTVYYFNLRFWDKVGGNPVDACAVDTVANGFNCGGILQIR